MNSLSEGIKLLCTPKGVPDPREKNTPIELESARIHIPQDEPTHVTTNGYTKIPHGVWALRISASQKLVLVALLRFNPCFPTVSILIKMTGLSRRAVWRCLRGLQASGIITRHQATGVGRSKITSSIFRPLTAREVELLVSTNDP